MRLRQRRRPLYEREEYFHIADSDDGYVSELVRGIVVRDPGIACEHGHLQGKLFRYLDEWMERFGQGMVSVDCGCILTEDPDTVRFPDMAVILGQSARDWLHGVPDVAIEVLFPSNTPQGIRERTQDYFDAGALRFWIVDPKARTVLIRRADGASTLFGDTDRLGDPEMLPGFALEMGVLLGGDGEIG